MSGAGPRDLASTISRVFFGVGSSSWAFCESLSGASEDGNSVKLSRLTPQTSITTPSWDKGKGGLGTLADLLRPREPRTLAILLRPQTHDLFARSRPGTPKKVMGPPEEGTLAD